jgi:hypothetical protein
MYNVVVEMTPLAPGPQVFVAVVSSLVIDVSDG